MVFRSLLICNDIYAKASFISLVWNVTFLYRKPQKLTLLFWSNLSPFKSTLSKPGLWHAFLAEEYTQLLHWASKLKARIERNGSSFQCWTELEHFFTILMYFKVLPPHSRSVFFSWQTTTREPGVSATNLEFKHSFCTMRIM